MQQEVAIGIERPNHKHFDDAHILQSRPLPHKICQIKVQFNNEHVWGLKILYKDGQGKTFKGDSSMSFKPLKSMFTSLTKKKFDIPDDDFLKEIHGYVGTEINQIGFVTYKGKKETFGVQKGVYFQYHNPHHTFSAARGSYDKFLDFIAFRVVKLSEPFIIKLCPQTGVTVVIETNKQVQQPGYPQQQGYPPQQPGYPPQQPGYPPQQPGYPPQQPGYPPQQQGYPPQQPGYPPQQPGYPPQQPGYPPQQQGYPQQPGYPPQQPPGQYPQQGGYPPQGYPQQPGYPQQQPGQYPPPQQYPQQGYPPQNTTTIIEVNKQAPPPQKGGGGAVAGALIGGALLGAALANDNHHHHGHGRGGVVVIETHGHHHKKH